MKKKQRTQLLVILCITFVANITLAQALKTESTEEVQTVWLEALKNSKSLASFYSERSGIMRNDELYIGLEEINKQLVLLIEHVGLLNNYTPIEVFQLRPDEKFVLGTYDTATGITLSTLIGWKNEGRWTKEFEVIYRNSEYSKRGAQIVHQARARWEKHSNQHRPDAIVSDVFSKNGKYFNRGRLFNGKEIIDAYSYMFNETYKIKLEALKVLQVNDAIIYDIGTFEVGGKGLYTLIWKREANDWKLLLDFNF